MEQIFIWTRRRNITLLVVAISTLALLSLPAWADYRELLSALNIPMSRVPWGGQDRLGSKPLAVDPGLVPLFGQRDPQWAKKQLGSCPGITMYSSGCFVTCKAMLYNYYHAGWMTPQELNEFLTTHGGYMNGCDLAWEGVGEQAFGGPPGVTYQGSMWGDPTTDSEVRARVDSELSQGYPVLAWVRKPGFESHMVVLTASEGNTYRINDPRGTYGVRAKLIDYRYSVIKVFFYHGPVPDQTAPILDVRALLQRHSDHACNLTLRISHQGSRGVLASYVIPMDSQGQYNGLRLDGIANGTYDITASVPYHLVKRVTQFLRPGSNTVDFGTLVGGDANNDNTVNALDLSLLINDIYTSNPRSDVDGNGIVNARDYNFVVDNYFMQGDELSTTQASVAQPATGRVGRVWIDPASTAHSVGDVFTLQVMLDTGGAEVSAVNITLKFDPGVLHYRWTSGNLSPFTYTFGEDMARGEIKIGAYVCASCEPFRGTGALARVGFDVLASIDSSTVAVDFQLGSTTDSNLAEYGTAADVLGSAQGTSLTLSGTPARPMPTGQIITPWDGSDEESNLVYILVDAEDRYNQLQRVDFEGYFCEDILSPSPPMWHYIGEGIAPPSPPMWHYIGSDTDGHDGWSTIAWLGEPVFDEAIGYRRWQLRAKLVLNSGQSVEVPSVTFSPLDMALDCFLVKPKPGRDIYTIVARHGGDASDVFENLLGIYVVGVPWPMTKASLESLIAEYASDPDVEYAQPDYIYYLCSSPVESPQILVPGWNLISLKVRPDVGDLSSLLAPIAGLYDQVLTYDASNPALPWRGYAPDRPAYANALDQIDETMGIWLHMRDSAELSISGTWPDSVPIPLHAGWNLIGFPFFESLPLEDALASIAGKYTHVATYIAEQSKNPWKEYDSLWPSSDNTLTAMDPGRGYWILVTQDCTLLIGNSEPPSLSLEDDATKLSLSNSMPVTQAWAPPPLPATFYGLVKENGSDVPDGTTVSAWINGTMYAQTSTQTYQGSSVYAIVVPGDNPATTMIEGGADGDLVTFTVGGEQMDQVVLWRTGVSVQVDLGVSLYPPMSRRIYLPIIHKNW